ncbi:MAG: nitroreductase family protein [Methanospirillum sp.]|uniref:nitroreductase family protein n=1 Tax=Methanospirillum sp. TaxID=45200 RepID=UPI00236BF6AE|nr:nitroreductase family protein [Methanospirillum sp.]MDD1729228.1 nitroreductase family protein [Methanospirillum sp.]
MNLGATLIKSRRSVRSFTHAPVDNEIIHETLECARLAPTAMNLQPWLFGAVTDKALMKQISDMTDHGRFIEGAAVCFAVFGEKEAKYYLEDCCAATENMIICLQGYGLGTCWVAGDKKDYAEPVRKLLNVPEKYTLVSLIACGFPKEISMPKKKHLDVVSFTDTWKEETS